MGMTFLEAAEVVLRKAQAPLTVREITEIALRRGLLETHGKTPEATMSAALYGAARDGRIRREFVPGRQRAVRGSVRWLYVDHSATGSSKPQRSSAARAGSSGNPARGG